VIAIFLGAGFSAAGGVPLARGLFDEEPIVDRVTRRRLIERVLGHWQAWHARTGGFPEEYLAHLQDGGGQYWRDAVWYVGLVIALKMGTVEYVGMKPTITRHNLDRTTRIDSHEMFWSTVFRKTYDVVVVTTNYDILAERGIRYRARPRVPRPGFHYGAGPEALAGGGYPSYAHIHKSAVSGSVPLLKLHGSISWSFRDGNVIRYHDCRPAVRGDPAILAPVTRKRLPEYLIPVWSLAASKLAQATTWVFVGYSLPLYDELVLRLLRDNSSHRPEVHVFDPNEGIAHHYREHLGLEVYGHPGLPDGISHLDTFLPPITLYPR
jgi:hypothetical protein